MIDEEAAVWRGQIWGLVRTGTHFISSWYFLAILKRAIWQSYKIFPLSLIYSRSGKLNDRRSREQQLLFYRYRPSYTLYLLNFGRVIIVISLPITLAIHSNILRAASSLRFHNIFSKSTRISKLVKTNNTTLSLSREVPSSHLYICKLLRKWITCQMIGMIPMMYWWIVVVLVVIIVA